MMGILSTLFLMLVVLKITGLLHVSWVLCLAPLAVLVVGFIFFVILGVIAGGYSR